ncbi:hypothetical protein TUM22923_05950 [Polynucleobacter sp. TUM22923]|jgi:hypothetical protein|uniref:hypothetical protein n=1 Tax=Polynucleobacter sp. TUM22923 TaxID=3022126 RepID=UPI002574217E|nr:hypothetical protein [Polynucleobacter sp. TUM22923]BDX21274.1 hypothetical protein TUM22923_05950 [Polynucleobacter sp. TUM22923]
MDLKSQANVISAKITLEINEDEKIQKVFNVVTDLVLDIRDDELNRYQYPRHLPTSLGP